MVIISTMLLCSCSCTNNLNNEHIDLVLDWVPNTNHTGIYVAKTKGYFEAENLDVKIYLPPEDSSMVLVASGRGDFCIGFQESLIFAASSNTPLPVTAVASIMQHNTSGILFSRHNDLSDFKNLQGKSYLSWGSPVEQKILEYAVKKDGGDFKKVNIIEGTLNDIITSLNTNVYATTAYYGWDGISAKLKLDADFIPFADIDCDLDCYSPLIIANNEYLNKYPQTVKRFLRAISKGYEYAANNPEESAEILMSEECNFNRELVLESQKWISKKYIDDAAHWGLIDENRWNNFNLWLYKNGIIRNKLKNNICMNNSYLLESIC